ncbi:hypothetical protein A0256_05455 [Mucilaginibacter sp. PAMC 26640]|nr:hypothetical protein A0256_05455 [Mucilaginibacter sp. PAMC 26640]
MRKIGNNLNLITLKKYILLVAVTITSLAAKAQGGYNYNSFGFGIGVSYLKPLADLKKNYSDLGYHADFTFYYNPYIPVALEFQTGTLRGGGDNISDDLYTRKFNNKYKALLLHVDYQLGDALDYERNGFFNILKNFYGGIGAGIVFNNVTTNRYSLVVPNYKFPGVDKSMSFAVPLRVGYEFKVFDYYGVPKFGITLGYEHTFTIGEGLDGYNDPTGQFKNNAADQYRQVTIGLKYNFGYENSYDKSIKGN